MATPTKPTGIAHVPAPRPAMTGPSSTAGPATSPWLDATKLRPRAAARLFCLPYAGGGASVFLGWPDLLPQLDVVPVQLPGRERRIGESPVVAVDQLVDALLPHADRPYAIFGHSFGARLAFELCRALRARAAPDPKWLFVSGCHAPQLPRLAPSVSLLSEDQLIAWVIELGGTPPEIFENPQMRALALRVLRADLAYAEQSVFQEAPPLLCPITVFAGQDDTETQVAGLHAWSELTSSAFAARVLPGDHFFLHSARHQLLASIAADLATGPAGTTRIAVPGLQEGDVHVWQATLDELALPDGVLRSFLAPDEQTRADRFRFRRDASRFVRRRWLLRRLLAAYGADPGTATFATGPNGKPSSPAATSVRFSASSSGGLAVVAVARHTDIGVDLERLRPVGDRELLAQSTMTANERSELAAVAGEGEGGHDAAFLRLWTVKEAFMKALGTGLSLEPRRITTTRTATDRWTASSCEPNRSCSVFVVDVGSRSVVSLAVPEETHVRLRSLSLTKDMLS